MKKDIFRNICNSLKKDDEPDRRCFYVEGALKPSDVQINIVEVGKIDPLPTQQDIQKLIAISSKAKFGLGDKTLLDENIRDTQEISRDKLRVIINEDALSIILTNIKNALELSDDTTLVPHLHNLLVYGKDQFFNKHQDTEKLEGMVTTLVMILPSPHIGGDLIVEHNKKQCIFSSENIDCNMIKYTAFYADCHHEIKKTTQGSRIALTYNLVLTSKNIAGKKMKILI